MELLGLRPANVCPVPLRVARHPFKSSSILKTCSVFSQMYLLHNGSTSAHPGAAVETIPGMNMKVPFGWSSSFQLPVVCLISRCSSAELWDPAVTKWLALCEMNFKQRKRSRWERRHLIGSGVMSD